MLRRRERRLPFAIPILMRSAQSCSETPSNGCTLDVTSNGARVQLQSDWEIGDVIWVERRGKRCQFRVVWMGARGAAKQRQIGIECLESYFDWGVDLPQEPDVVIDNTEFDYDVRRTRTINSRRRRFWN